MKLTDLIAAAPWREAVTFRDTWPHEYVLLQKDGERELMRTVCQPATLTRRTSTTWAGSR